jgi:ABC-type multidrug transport system fused ATPase/permease subunit
MSINHAHYYSRFKYHKNADRIIVIGEGEIITQFSHMELMEG